MGTPDANIPNGHESPCAALPVSQEFLEPFIAAACVTLREWANTDVVVESVYRQTLPRTIGDLSAVVSFVPASAGALILSCHKGTAAALAGRILSDVTQDLDESVIRDCLGEIANVIAGQAKTLLVGTPYHFVFSTPTLVCGAGQEIRPQLDRDCLVLTFNSDVGALALQLFLDL